MRWLDVDRNANLGCLDENPDNTLLILNYNADSYDFGVETQEPDLSFNSEQAIEC